MECSITANVPQLYLVADFEILNYQITQNYEQRTKLE
jgi:hypothetical protein